MLAVPPPQTVLTRQNQGGERERLALCNPTYNSHHRPRQTPTSVHHSVKSLSARPHPPWVATYTGGFMAHTGRWHGMECTRTPATHYS